jgi:hypothetical protein
MFFLLYINFNYLKIFFLSLLFSDQNYKKYLKYKYNI